MLFLDVLLDSEKASSNADLKFALVNWGEDSPINHRQKTALSIPLFLKRSLRDKMLFKTKYCTQTSASDNLKKSRKIFK